MYILFSTTITYRKSRVARDTEIIIIKKEPGDFRRGDSYGTKFQTLAFAPVHWQRTIEDPIGDTVGRQVHPDPVPPSTTDGSGYFRRRPAVCVCVTSLREKRFRAERSGSPFPAIAFIAAVEDRQLSCVRARMSDTGGAHTAGIISIYSRRKLRAYDGGQRDRPIRIENDGGGFFSFIRSLRMGRVSIFSYRITTTRFISNRGYARLRLCSIITRPRNNAE